MRLSDKLRLAELLVEWGTTVPNVDGHDRNMAFDLRWAVLNDMRQDFGAMLVK